MLPRRTPDLVYVGSGCSRPSHEGKTYIAGDRFTAADVLFGSQLNFITMFGMLEPKPVFTDYIARLTSREAYQRAKRMDADAGEAMKKRGLQTKMQTMTVQQTLTCSRAASATKTCERRASLPTAHSPQICTQRARSSS